MPMAEYYELDIVEVARDIASKTPGVTSIKLFGSRKFPGKVRSDLDLLITGPTNLESLLSVRNSLQHYQPLDLWLVTGESAISAVNGSTLPVAALRTYELYPICSDLPTELQRQRFRADIQYTLTVIPPGSYTPIRADHLGLTTRLPMLLDAELIRASETLVEIISNGFEAIRRMRGDGNARRGRGTQLTMFDEYDVQNLTELLLSPIVSLDREPFTVRCQGIKRSADFSFAGGRLVLELKMAKDRGDLASALKDAKGVLNCYLDHPGVEIALAILAVTPAASANKNSIESWTETRGDRCAFMRVVNIPAEILAVSGTSTR